MTVPPSPEQSPTLAGAVFVDLEVQDDRLRVGALVSGDQPWVFTHEQLEPACQVMVRVPALVGHNVRRFDLPQLRRLRGQPFAADLDARVVDTLELSSLVFPGEPSQALDKLYREHARLSDPVEDCRECAEVLRRCLVALPDLPPLVRAVARTLLPAGATRDLIPGGAPDWESLETLPLPGSWPALREHLEALPAGDWDNLGGVVLLHWLFRSGDLVCRWPAWVEATFPSFQIAEQVALPVVASY